MDRIRIYSQPTCPACKQLKDYLKSKDVEFDDLDVTADSAAMEELVRVHKVRVTPLTVAGERKVVGFDPVAIDKLLTEAR